MKLSNRLIVVTKRIPMKFTDMENEKSDCLKRLIPIVDALDVLKGKWKIPIIGVLCTYEKVGFKELQRYITGITAKVLSKELKDLESYMIVTRTVMDTRPITVTYTITPFGKTCEPLIMEIYKWGNEYRDRIIGAMKNEAQKKRP